MVMVLNRDSQLAERIVRKILFWGGGTFREVVEASEEELDPTWVRLEKPTFQEFTLEVQLVVRMDLDIKRRDFERGRRKTKIVVDGQRRREDVGEDREERRMKGSKEGDKPA